MPIQATTPAQLYIGTYTQTGSKGIYLAEFDFSTGSLREPRLVAEMPSPSFLALSARKDLLFAVSESTASVYAYARTEPSGALHLLNIRETGGAAPCDVAIDATGATLAVANYNGGSVVSYHIGPDGSLSEPVTLRQHSHASATHPKRQAHPHAHGVTFSPDNRLLLVPDLGGDRVYLYTHDAHTSVLAPHPTQPWLALPAGSGPRHAQFSADGRHIYIINELANTVSLADYDATRTLPLRLGESISTLPDGFSQTNTAAEIALSPDGRFVYASNRGHDSLVVYARDSQSGTLKPIQTIPCGGRSPRHFAFSPDGNWLLCANQDSNTLSIFRVDAHTGLLTANPPALTLPRPVCTCFCK